LQAHKAEQAAGPAILGICRQQASVNRLGSFEIPGLVLFQGAGAFVFRVCHKG
jgi:hypothetical protein